MRWYLCSKFRSKLCGINCTVEVTDVRGRKLISMSASTRFRATSLASLRAFSHRFVFVFGAEPHPVSRYRPDKVMSPSDSCSISLPHDSFSLSICDAIHFVVCYTPNSRDIAKLNIRPRDQGDACNDLGTCPSCELESARLISEHVISTWEKY
jgi:hypothetical protein